MELFRLQEGSINATCSAGRTVMYLSDYVGVSFFLKQEDFSTTFSFIYMFHMCTVREVTANQNGLEFNDTLEM
jgi:hypothetical protein